MAHGALLFTKLSGIRRLGGSFGKMGAAIIIYTTHLYYIYTYYIILYKILRKIIMMIASLKYIITSTQNN